MRVSTFATLVVLAFATTAAHAQINVTKNPGNFLGDENVLFHGDGLVLEGSLVQGMTNRSHAIVDFYGANTDLLASGGQAKLLSVSAKDGGSFNTLTLGMHDQGTTFSTLIYNLNAIADGQVTFSVDTGAGIFQSQTFDLNKGGQNFFMFEGLNSTAMSSVSFSSSVGIHDVKQVRIGGVQAVPEPASMAGLGLGALALLRRRKAKKA